MFCTKIKGRMRAILRQFDACLDANVATALRITTALKRLLASPVADVLTALIPGEADNVVRQQLLAALTKAVEALTIANACRQYTGADEKIACFIAQLRQHDPELQDALLQKLASLLTRHLDGGRLKQSLYDLYTQAKVSATKQA